MKKTGMKVCIGKKKGYDIYRIVFESEGHYFVKCNNSIINVDEDIKTHHYTYK